MWIESCVVDAKRRGLCIALCCVSILEMFRRLDLGLSRRCVFIYSLGTINNWTLLSYSIRIRVVVARAERDMLCLNELVREPKKLQSW